MTRYLLLIAAIVGLVAAISSAQDVQESDLFFADRSNLSRLLDEAARSVRGGQPALASATLATVLEAVGDARSLIDLRLRAQFLRVEVAIANDDLEAADAEIETLLGLDPAARPPDDTPRPVTRRYDRLTKKRVGRLSIESAPPGAAVTIEGRALGVTPLKDVPVLVGRHYLKVERVGFAMQLLEAKVGAGKTTRLTVELERTNATFLLLTDTHGADVRIDDVAMGQALRPSDARIDELINTFNLPIDPYQPPALFLWPDAVPGRHRVELTARCRRPEARIVEVPEGADSTTIMPMSPAFGAAYIDGPLDMSVRIDGEPAGPPPIKRTDLCPGAHRVEVRSAKGQRTSISVFVETDRQSDWTIQFQPVLGLLGTASKMPALPSVSNFNVLLLDDPSTPHSLMDDSGDVRQVLRDQLAAAHGVDLFAWVTGDGEIALLAATSPRFDLVAVDDLVSRLATDIPLTAATLGISAVQTRLGPNPIAIAIEESGGARAVGVKVGDGISQIGHETAVLHHLSPDSTDVGSTIELTLQRATGPTTVVVPVRERGLDVDLGRLRASPNVVIARLTATTNEPNSPRTDARQQVVVGKAFLALGAWAEAHRHLVDVDVESLPDEEIGRIYYYRALAAFRAGQLRAARDAALHALRFPDTHVGAHDSVGIVTLLSSLLNAIDTRLAALD